MGKNRVPRYLTPFLRKTGAEKAWVWRLSPFLIALAASALCLSFDVADMLHDWLARLERYEADEVALSIVLFALAALYAMGRRQSALEARLRERAVVEIEADKLTRIDDLTGLGNRRAFMQALKDAEIGFYLIMIDLDQFHTINDWSGHLLGDKVLAEVGDRLSRIEEAGDIRAVARLGGDQFGCLTIRDPDRVAARILTAISEPMARLPDMPRVTASIGIAPLGHHLGSLDSPLRDADHALVAAKRAGGNTARQFDKPVPFNCDHVKIEGLVAEEGLEPPTRGL